MQNKWLYIVWFRDNSLNLDDQDYEWPACIIVEANKSEEAWAWGDYLAKKHCTNKNKSCEFLRSDVKILEVENKNSSSVPHIKHGYEATDDEIGW